MKILAFGRSEQWEFADLSVYICGAPVKVGLQAVQYSQ